MSLNERLDRLSSEQEPLEPVDVEAALRSTIGRYRSRRRRKRALLAVGCTAATLMLAAVGIIVSEPGTGKDSVAAGDALQSPPALPHEQRPVGPWDGPSATDAGTRAVAVFLLRVRDSAGADPSVGLVRVPRYVDAPAGVEGALGSLFTTPPDGGTRPAESGLFTAVPPNARLLSVTADPLTESLTVNVKGLFDKLTGTSLRNALAQIVWTATEDARDMKVSFLSDGRSTSAITGEGRAVDRAVTRRDYQQPL